MSSTGMHHLLTRLIVFSLLLGAAPLSTGCYQMAGDDEENDTSEEGEPGSGSTVCTGGSDLWVGYQLFASWSYDAPGHSMFEENGWRYFVIDRSCRFYVMDGTDGDPTNRYYGLADVYTGTITDKEANAVKESLSMDTWSDHYGTEYRSDEEDCGIAYFFDTQGTFGCKCNCREFQEPSRISDVGATIAEMLVDMGTPATGPLRVITMPYDDDCCFSYVDGEDPQRVPVGFDPATIAIDPCTDDPDTASQSHLLDGNLAADLRSIRQDYREELLSDYEDVAFYRVPMDTSSREIYDVFMRDYIPLENDKGILNPHDTARLEHRGDD